MGGSATTSGDGTAFMGLDHMTPDHAGFLHTLTVLRHGERQLTRAAGQDLGALDDYSRAFITRQVAPELARCLGALG